MPSRPSVRVAVRRLVLCGVVWLTGCDDPRSHILAPDEPPLLAVQTVGAASDAPTGTFGFLPPLGVPRPVTGELDLTLAPVVDICLLHQADCAGSATTMPARLATRDDDDDDDDDDEGSRTPPYTVRWRTRGLAAGDYRITARVGTVVLGRSDVRLADRGPKDDDEGRGGRKSQNGPLTIRRGRTLAIRFHVAGDPLIRAADRFQRGITAEEVAAELMPILPECGDPGASECVESMTRTLRAAGYDAPAVGEVLHDVFQHDAVAAQRLLALAGYSTAEVDAVLHASYADWVTWRNMAVEAAIVAIDGWLNATRMIRVKVTSVVAMGGEFTSLISGDIAASMRRNLSGRGIPGDVVEAFAAATEDAWVRWARSVRIPTLPLYPHFIFPTPSHRTVPALPVPMRLLLQDTEPLVTDLAGSVRTRFGASGTLPEAVAAADAFASAVRQCHGEFLSITVLYWIYVVEASVIPDRLGGDLLLEGIAETRFPQMLQFCPIGADQRQPSPESSSMTVNSSSVRLGESVSITVTARNGAGDLLRGAQILLEAFGVEASLSQPAPTGDDGTTTVTLTAGNVPGPILVIGRADGTVLLDVVQLRVITPLSPARSTLSAGASAIHVGGSTPIEIEIRDILGQPVSGVPVSLSGAGAIHTLSTPPPTDADGRSTALLRSTGSLSGVITVSGSVDGIPIGAAMVVVLGEVSPLRSTISAGASTLHVGRSTPIDIVILDILDQPVEGVTVSLAGAGADHELSTPAATDASGRTTALLRSTGTLPGVITVAGSANGTPIGVVTVAVLGEASPLRSTVTAGGTTIPVGGSTPITIVAIDALGRPVPGVSVSLSGLGASHVLSEPGPTDGAGRTSGLLRSIGSVPGVVTVTASANGILIGTVTVVVLGEASPVRSTVTASPNAVVRDGGTSTIVVTARDLAGNPLAGAQVSLAATAVPGTALARLTTPGRTNPQGRATATLTAGTIGTVTITARINGVVVGATVVTVTLGVGGR